MRVRRDSVAVTVTLVRVEVANARQISAVPPELFVRCTSVQVRPAPVTLLTVVAVVLPTLPTNASSSSLGAVVENAASPKRVAAVA